MKRNITYLATARDKVIFNMASDGSSLSEIAKFLGVTELFVVKRARMIGETLRKKNNGYSSRH